ncbi:hypothetical protein M124_4023 [Bacteroides fragilis str. 3988T(B)14]|uniref:Transmembrane protein n=1 Tax=Bacteroides fragilis str. 3988T(B)14 TaxID=1339315 RepID=A0A015UTG4_BACFG|nr:hypothetical protein M124_4023 [Bacteroides fragilis str. 3988T(B)14]
MCLAFLPMGKLNSHFLIFTSITFEYVLIINSLMINGFVLDSKTIDFN